MGTYNAGRKAATSTIEKTLSGMNISVMTKDEILGILTYMQGVYDGYGDFLADYIDIDDEKIRDIVSVFLETEGPSTAKREYFKQYQPGEDPKALGQKYTRRIIWDLYYPMKEVFSETYRPDDPVSGRDLYINALRFILKLVVASIKAALPARERDAVYDVQDTVNDLVTELKKSMEEQKK